MAICIVCKAEMPDERLELDLYACKKCSDQSVYIGAPHYDGKTGHSITPIKNSTQNKEAVRMVFNLGTCIIRRATPKGKIVK